MNELKNKASRIRLLTLDVDGVLTDGRLFFDNQGNEYKAFHARDGHGIKLLRRSGVEIAVISGRKAESVKLRMESLGIEHVYQGQEDKIAALEEIAGRLGIRVEESAHMGDDLLDLPVMKRAGFSIAVGDAHFAVKDYADWCTQLPGGAGAVREACDFIMQAQGKLEEVIRSYLK
ncbi:MAG: 3-deoxy-manno-octulosonate-8-phosphatase KdsC [Gammaproteobacteria bacterium]